MITSIQIGNIRLFESPQNFNLSPLSLFCGTNSSGKSTILRTILLLRQSQGIFENTRVRDGHLKFVGSQVDFGDYISTVTHNDRNKDIEITITIEDKMPIMFRDVLLSINNNIEDSKISNDTKNRIPYNLKCKFIFSAFNPTIEELNENTFEYIIDNPPRSSRVQGLLRRADFNIIIDNNNILDWYIEIDENNNSNQNPSYSIYLPTNYCRNTGMFDIMEIEPTNDTYIKLSTVLRGLIPNNILAKRKRKSRKQSDKSEGRLGVFPIPPYIQDAFQDFQSALININYLGPLRSPAKRYYIVPEAIATMDTVGEFLPYVLRDRANHIVTNIRPREKQERRETLLNAMNSWLYYLRTGESIPSTFDTEIKISNTKDILIEFKIKTPNGITSHSFADSGFGYSQLLPILIRGLLAKNGSTLIVEQPELHLNPSMQVRLSEFFVAMANIGKQVIVETHSEHLVNMIRVLSAEDELNIIANKCTIFYIQSTNISNKVYELSVRPDGTMTEWPTDFFGEAITLTSRLLKAQKRHRMK